MQAEIQPKKIQKIVIVGGGTAGWMAAALLARTMGSLVDIRLIESDEIGTVGVGEATIPQIKLFNRALGFDENDFLRNTQGTFKLGIQFTNWGKVGDSYIHAFSGIGIDLGMLDFYQYWFKSQQQGNPLSLWDYSLNAVSAKQNRFAKMERVGETNLPGINYAYHFDASLFAKYLRKYSEQYKVTRTEGKVVEARLRAADGFIESVVLQSGEIIEGDLFKIAPGFAAC